MLHLLLLSNAKVEKYEYFPMEMAIEISPFSLSQEQTMNATWKLLSSDLLDANSERRKQEFVICAMILRRVQNPWVEKWMEVVTILLQLWHRRSTFYKRLINAEAKVYYPPIYRPANVINWSMLNCKKGPHTNGALFCPTFSNPVAVLSHHCTLPEWTENASDLKHNLRLQLCAL